MADYAGLLQYATTPSQAEIVKACIKHGSQTKAASSLGKDRRAVDRTVQTLIVRAATMGHAPDHGMTKTAPPGFTVKGTSTLYDAESGEAKLQWVKIDRDLEQQRQAITEALQDSFADLKPLPKVSAPKQTSKSLMAVYPMGDPHLGLYAWAQEAGENHDTDIAAADLFAAVDYLVDVAPACDTGVLLNLGDFFHSDNMQNRTARSGNALDVDTRWARVLSIGVQTMIRLIRRMLEKHRRVIVRNNIGNHDEHSSIMLAIALQAFFHDNKRVEIDVSPSPFWYIRHGKTLIGSTHGDRTKPADLPEIMAADCPKDWGDTRFRYWYTGHIHHTSKKEFRGCTVESFRTLAASDAWHHGQGYRSGRDMRCIVLHDQFGECGIHRFPIEQIR